MKQLIDRLIEPRLDRNQELIASSLGMVLGIALGGVVLACLSYECPKLVSALFG